MRILAVLLLLSFCSVLSYSQRLKVSENHRFLVTETGEPFFWLADTAWELFHRCTKEEIRDYLIRRREQGFNVIQAVALAELDGLNTPNANGDIPLIDNNPEDPNPLYFNFVEDVIDMADSLGMYIALLPTWGDKLFKESWGVGPEIFNVSNARNYGEWIGSRFSKKDNLIWVIGGDRNPRNDSDISVWRAMAQGIEKGFGGSDRALMTFHPQPRETGGSSTWFHKDEWLDFNMHQTGHCPNRGTYKLIEADYALTPVKPVLDGEPLYEEHPNCFNARELGYSVAHDIRRIMYWNVFAGAFGQTYGCHDIWQMYDLDKEPVNAPLRPWKKALDLPMANQVIHLKNLMLSRPFLSRIPDNSIVTEGPGDEAGRILATRDTDGSYAMIYLPDGRGADLDLSQLKSGKFTTWWYDPRTGASFRGPDFAEETNVNVSPPTHGIGNDWVLVIDADEFGQPGIPIY